MNEQILDLMLRVSWLRKERYQRGIKGLVSECSNLDEFRVIEYVLSNFKYCTSVDLDEAAVSATEVLQSTWKLPLTDTIIVGLAEPNRTCGSSVYLRAIEVNLPRCWSGSINTNFVSAFRHRNNNKNLVLIDDFVGTGDKLIKKINSLRNNPKTASYEIYIIAFAGMDIGLKSLENLVNGKIHSHIRLNKVISDSDITIEEALLLIDKMEILESKIFSNPRGSYNFGYKKSETGFFLEAGNIPNNNFPIFWWDKYKDNAERETLFSRR